MTCASCSASVENALSNIAGVKKASVALLQEQAVVLYNDALVTPEALVEAVEDAGFDAMLLSCKKNTPTSVPEVALLRVLHMTCAACSGSVEGVLCSLVGVSRATVSLTQAQAEVHYDSALIQPAALVQAVEDAGFEAMLLSSGGLQTLHLQIGGMTCGACSASVEKALLMQAGVSRAAVNVVTGTAEVWFNNSLSGPRHIIAAVEDAGLTRSCTAVTVTPPPAT
ncbi:MAG: hypothetical protein WDW38_005467 [Sanguina aurantia]